MQNPSGSQSRVRLVWPIWKFVLAVYLVDPDRKLKLLEPDVHPGVLEHSLH